MSPALEVVLRFIFAVLAYAGSGLFVSALIRNRQLEQQLTVLVERQARTHPDASVVRMAAGLFTPALALGCGSKAVALVVQFERDCQQRDVAADRSTGQRVCRALHEQQISGLVDKSNQIFEFRAAAFSALYDRKKDRHNRKIGCAIAITALASRPFDSLPPKR